MIYYVLKRQDIYTIHIEPNKIYDKYNVFLIKLKENIALLKSGRKSFEEKDFLDLL